MFLAFDIGCIECGEGSKVIGVFAKKEDADAAAEAADKLHKENWSGQHSMEVFEIEIPNE
jgi:hypothetical protein